MQSLTAVVLLSFAFSGANAVVQKSPSKELRKFPDGFLFGAATASYQVEGGWNASDKGENIWDHFIHTQPWRIKDNQTGDVACDSYNNYKRDVEIMRELGLHFYRFSFSWSRILPTGFSNQISEDGVAYYNNLINEMLKYNIQPMVTLYHWDLPQKLQDLGGWTNPLMIEWFGDYSRVAYELFGDRVKTWYTVNEPYSICYLTHTGGVRPFAPGVDAPGIGEYLCLHTLIRAHARAYHIYDEDFRTGQQGRVGYVMQDLWMEPATDSEDDIQAAKDYYEFAVGIFSHPIFSNEGDYPEIVKEYVARKSEAQGYPRSRLPVFTPEEIEYVRGSSDFYGTNHYTTHLGYREVDSPSYVKPFWKDDSDAIAIYDPNMEHAASDWLMVHPSGFRKMLNYLKDNYNNPEIIITENGYSTLGGLTDDDRISYHRQYLNALLDAIYEDGVNVTAYTAWSLMDNFEWASAYTDKFGLYEVDFESPERTRTARKSALVYKEIIRSMMVDPDYEPASLNITIN